MEEFRVGSPLHLLTVAVSVLVMAAFAVRGRALAGGDGERRLRRAWAIGIFVVAAVLLVRSLWPSTIDVRYTLPLHLCDVAFPLAGLALWGERRALHALAYFWGIGLSTQTFLTPILRLGPAHPEFWFFWIYHVQLVGAAVYVVAARGFRPRRRDFLTAWGATVAYALVILPLDVAFDWSYGFLGPDDSLGRGTILDLLPPWPWRLAALFAMVTVWMAVLWLAWPLVGRLRRARGRPAAG